MARRRRRVPGALWTAAGSEAPRRFPTPGWVKLIALAQAFTKRCRCCALPPQSITPDRNPTTSPTFNHTHANPLLLLPLRRLPARRVVSITNNPQPLHSHQTLPDVIDTIARIRRAAFSPGSTAGTATRRRLRRSAGRPARATSGGRVHQGAGREFRLHRHAGNAGAGRRRQGHHAARPACLPGWPGTLRDGSLAGAGRSHAARDRRTNEGDGH